MKDSFTWIEGGGAASAKGWLASGVEAGLKAGRTDMAMLLSDRPAASAAVFTSNRMPAAPVLYDRELARGGHCRGVVVNVGCANAATGKAGLADCKAVGE
ncbi:MAG: bifunctional ornithine acetyltransferase/N-acetylglutamate synthase, partial [Kiritimatiellae bacterium]|nr:bifunctional ornithine acetyltransferase/N-acetylglutamate synthase [Kiritimatiellia bacterium]